ncbi:MAG: hypothetical protein K2I23_03735 [Clostridia bacterium]|nr:hypothetical protein [Clostridia bacterium]
MQKTLTTKLVATTIGLVLIVTLIFCIAPVQTAHAEEVVWEKVDYENYLTYEDYIGADAYYGKINEMPNIRKYNYLYVFIVGAGGMGGASADGKSIGYGGGGGAFVVIKLNIQKADSIHFLLGKGGGKFEFSENDDYSTGDGCPSAVLISKDRTSTTPFILEGATCVGGKLGNSSAPGNGGFVENAEDIPTNSLSQIIYSCNGVAGGQASHSLSVDLGFRTEYFIYRPTGANPSGKGGGASVYHRGGDGGVLYKNGSDGSMGAGGGGAGKGATQGGYGGDAYMEIYGSNM